MYFPTRENRKTFTIILCLAVAYIATLVTMFIYERQTREILDSRFNNSVSRSILETTRKVEQRDIIRIIGDIATDTASDDNSARSTAALARNVELFARNIQVLARKYDRTSPRSIPERIDPQFLRQTLATEFTANGIDTDFSYVVICVRSGITERFGEKPFDYLHKGSDEGIFEHTLFHRDVDDRPLKLIVKVNGRSGYIRRYTRLVLPIFICMTILFVLLICTIYHLLRSERLTQIQKAFVKNMTHELKTPVASISLASEMLADPSLHFPPETYASKCRIINNEAKRLTNIIERVLQTSVLEQKHFTYKTEPVCINEIVTTARESFILKAMKQSEGSKILLHLNADRDVIYADRMHITNVVYNLMDNALKYHEPSRPLILEIVTRNVGDRLHVDFTDNGIGIKGEHLKHIFDKFYRVPTGDRHDVKGFGLGLSYVKHVVTHNGGNITVQSRPGVGTRFTLDFQAFSP